MDQAAEATGSDRCRVLEEFLENGVAPMAEPVDRAFTHEFQVACVNQLPSSGIVEVAADESLKIPVRVWKVALRSLLDADHTRELARVTAPTLLIWGAQDAFFPRADQEALLRSIPLSRLVVHNEAGHTVHWEEPEGFVRDVAGFVRAHTELSLQPA